MTSNETTRRDISFWARARNVSENGEHHDRRRAAFCALRRRPNATHFVGPMAAIITEYRPTHTTRNRGRAVFLLLRDHPAYT